MKVHDTANARAHKINTVSLTSACVQKVKKARARKRRGHDQNPDRNRRLRRTLFYEATYQERIQNSKQYGNVLPVCHNILNVAFQNVPQNAFTL